MKKLWHSEYLFLLFVILLIVVCLTIEPVLLIFTAACFLFGSIVIGIIVFAPTEDEKNGIFVKMYYIIGMLFGLCMAGFLTYKALQ
jgi:hypothetical protein